MRSSLDLSKAVDIAFMKRQAFHDTRVLIVSLDDPKIGWDERQLLENIGTKLYGKRKPIGR